MSYFLGIHISGLVKCLEPVNPFIGSSVNFLGVKFLKVELLVIHHILALFSLTLSH